MVDKKSTQHNPSLLVCWQSSHCMGTDRLKYRRLAWSADGEMSELSGVRRGSSGAALERDGRLLAQVGGGCANYSSGNGGYVGNCMTV